MSVLSRRSRLVNFRLTHDEYQRLLTACSTSGARSLSDYARTAVLRCASSQNNSGATNSFGERLLTLDQKVSDLEGHVQQLTELFHSLKAGERL